MRLSTPSSLKWLIDKRVRFAGQIQRKRDQLARHQQQATACKREINSLLKQLASIEGAMKLHEIQINPEDLRPIRPHYNGRVTSHGAMTRTIRRTLFLSPNHIASTDALLATVLKAMTSQPAADELERIRQRLRVRLCIMVRKGYLIRHTSNDPCAPRMWQLPVQPLGGS